MGSLGSNSISTIVVGAGIGGLAAAIGLARHGHRVTVLESKSALNEFGASIGITPCGTRVLKAWGLQEAFLRVVTQNGDLDVRDGASGEPLGRIALNRRNNAATVWGSEHWNIHRADYQRTLAEEAMSLGVEVLFSADVTSVTHDPPTVHLSDGRQLTADLIVGADGMRSAVRASIPKTSDVHPKPLFEQCFRCTVPKEIMRANPKLSWLLESGNEYVWSSPGRYVLSWPLRENSPYDVVTCIVRESDVPPGKWGIPGDAKAMAQEFADFCPTITELLSHIDGCIKWTLAELPPLSTCRSDNGKIILLGDAFHAMIPHSASGGVSAIEDGAVIGECVDWAVKNQRPLADATAAYEALRKPRVERMQTASHQGYGFLSASGDFRPVRDQMLAEQTKMQDEYLERPEEDRRKDEVPVPDKDAPFPTPPYLQWLYTYDAIGEAQKYLATL